MLGDGSLAWRTNNCYFSNTDKHKEYLVWLQKRLGIEDISRVTPRYHFVGDGNPFEYNLATRVVPSLRNEYKRWYPNGKGTRNNFHHKIILKDIELTLIKLLFWYIGDGTYNNNNNNNRKNIYFTNRLYFDDWALLSDKISNLLDVDNGVSIYKNCKDDIGKQRYILHLNRSVTHKFFGMVNSLGFDIPECYQYKFGSS